ncbi:C6 transcription factor [Penicillium lagena]|uniref:C6 transcription factor n=1 Tax=Penicillium lagena TaxID=94218 RepID=UPI00253F8703|nr:C6 transcription factor [Penicillium lagena]KAJ5619055.1 C6 transcription factor [Penicillium lagena]
MTDSTPPRKRSRAACVSCQARKRKCSGDQPCSTCAQAGVECIYSTVPKKRARSNSLYRPSLSAPDDQRPALDGYSALQTRATGKSYSLEANSGAAFVRKLGLRIDPAHAPRLHLFAWNVGERRRSPGLSVSAPTPSTITKIVSQEEMQRLTGVFFDKIHSCYNFLEKETVSALIAKRWSIDSPDQSYDAVLCGVAALGHLFSQREIVATELQLVEAARILLEKSVLSAETPSVDTVSGWVLRAAYLRMTAPPHAAWMVSCTLMHLVEAAGLHLEPQDREAAGLLATRPNGDSTASSNQETRRRLFGMARHLNTWISFDLGRSRIVLHGATALPPTPAAHQWQHPKAHAQTSSISSPSLKASTQPAQHRRISQNSRQPSPQCSISFTPAHP